MSLWWVPQRCREYIRCSVVLLDGLHRASQSHTCWGAASAREPGEFRCQPSRRLLSVDGDLRGYPDSNPGASLLRLSLAAIPVLSIRGRSPFLWWLGV